jgi:hypothetical protein
VSVFVGIASRAAQWAFFGDFNRERGHTSAQGATPGFQNWGNIDLGHDFFVGWPAQKRSWKIEGWLQKDCFLSTSIMAMQQ